MKREGSPWTGLWAVVLKEYADHLSSVRMRILEGLILVVAVATVYAAAQSLRQTVGEDPFIYLKLLTTSQDPLPSFVAFMGFLIPLTGIALAFDAVNGEYNRRTMSRLLAQPIYRDAVLMGKFVAGLLTMATTLLGLWLLVTGLGILRLGVIPEAREVGRGLFFLLATLAYGGVWMALAMLFSVTYRQPATSAMATLAVWLFFAVFWEIVVRLLSNVAALVVMRGGTENELALVQVQLFLSRLSPNTLYSETVLALLNPDVRALGPVLITQLEGAVRGTMLPLWQSLVLAWPQFTALIAAVILLFAYAYILFQRQEVRA
ncbi:MAG: ABC transporter permease [Armatimonadota bacterium]|nr:ABC transporter permease [Armatimonadota bacterium]MDR7421840.1 ABC transporter permease [Armatimonadota bacterium]MDR7455458.1 ABC transporter permease [Armatimonadota bacterium]MDR7457740.1 ABC transporter permease [Armatimonadota bacterium]MDR7497523.1 ABC transporter permease [Armatimonadota bacterium]